MSYLDHAYAVILAGGGGTRLWPKSRNKTPKQFLKLTGDDSMTQITAKRINKVVDWSRMIVVTNQAYIDEVRAELPQVPHDNIIAEPQKRETAMAMLVGALYAQSLDPKAIVMNAASDHVVINEDEYAKVMKAALEVAAEEKYLLAIGISPTYPSTGFGYIEVGEKISTVGDGLPLSHVASFKEKPDKETAVQFIASGKYYWNANMYVWSASALVTAFQEQQAEMYQVAQSLAGLTGSALQAALPAVYDQVQAISIDYAISEKVHNLALLPGNFGWNDVGDWRVVYELGKKDEQGNVMIKDDNNHQALILNSRNNMIQTNGRLVALYGINDMVVIDTPEILMIIPKNVSQDVKKLVEQLKKDNKKEYL